MLDKLFPSVPSSNRSSCDHRWRLLLQLPGRIEMELPRCNTRSLLPLSSLQNFWKLVSWKQGRLRNCNLWQILELTPALHKRKAWLTLPLKLLNRHSRALWSLLGLLSGYNFHSPMVVMVVTFTMLSSLLLSLSLLLLFVTLCCSKFQGGVRRQI